MKGEIVQSTIVVGDFNTPLSIIDGMSRKKISKYITYLKIWSNQLDIINIYITQ